MTSGSTKRIELNPQPRSRCWVMSALAWQSPLLGGILSTSMVLTQLFSGLRREHLTSDYSPETHSSGLVRSVCRLIEAYCVESPAI